VRRVLLSCLAAALLGVAAPAPAHAYGEYRGGCSFATMNNPTGSGALGGRSMWTGVVFLYVVPADGSIQAVPTGGAVSAWCELKINGVSQGDVLGPVSGTGAVAAAGPIQFRAGPDDVVALCDHVTTDLGSTVDCGDITETPIVPQPVQDIVDAVLGTGTPVAVAVDTVACAALVAVAPAVDAAGRPDLLWIDPATGDTHSGPYWVYDCPPYVP
jgi:hypothetical protein